MACCMISLEEEHYNGHIKDHPKDADYLNTHLVNYAEMQNIFGTGVATGRFTMGSNEAFGEAVEQQEQETIDVDNDAPKPAAPKPASGSDKGSTSGGLGKRKRGMSEEEGLFYGGLIKSVDGLANAVREGTPGIYQAVMGCPTFSKSAQMHCLNFLMKNKGVAETFLEMDVVDMEFWMSDHLASTKFYD